jgi:hypothetical protein
VINWFMVAVAVIYVGAAIRAALAKHWLHVGLYLSFVASTVIFILQEAFYGNQGS